MANYTQIANDIYVEQNIYSDSELCSYENSMIMADGSRKTPILYYHNDGKNKLYSLGLLENLHLPTVTIVGSDLTNILKFKTAKTRRKYLYKMILG